MSNYYLQQIWHQVEEILRGAKKIYFCGYSFPDADIHVKYLIKRAEMFKGDPFEIIIINDHKRKTRDQKEEEERRFRRFFGSKHRIDYLSKSFETFVDELQVEMNK
jgi:hypothetical protein